MASAKQIAWRKKFAKMAKSGKFKKSKTKISRKAQFGIGMKAYQNAEKSTPQPMTEKELKGFPDDDWFKEYKRLGGKKTRKQYEKNVNIFVYHTHDIFIHGDASKYKNRGEALEAVKKEAKIDNKELNKLFDSISNITAWT